jgi:hypothetical protein
MLISGFENPDIGIIQGVYSPPRTWALALRVNQ